MSLAHGQMGSLCVARIRTAECLARPAGAKVWPRGTIPAGGSWRPSWPGWGPRKLGSEHTVNHLALPVRTARGSESLSRAASSKYPSHPNCWYSPVGRFYSPHSNVIW